LELLPSQFNTSISARINTAPAGSGGFFYNLFGVISNEIWGMIKTTAPYQLPRYKTLELVVEYEPISSSDNYDPTSIPESSNLVMAEERTHYRAREQRPSRVSVQNMDVDVDEDDEVEEWHLDVEEDNIQDATNINMDETHDAVDVEEIVKEWQMSIPFINRGMKHPCAQFADNTPMSYADEPYFRQKTRMLGTSLKLDSMCTGPSLKLGPDTCNFQNVKKKFRT
jgi:hypothetical protein